MGKLFIKIHSVVYIYVWLCLVPHTPGFRLQNFVAQNGQFYVQIHTLIRPEGGPPANFRDITAITFSCPTLLCISAPGPALLWSCLACRHDQPMLHAVPPFWSRVAPLAKRVELCVNLAFLCVCHYDSTKPQPCALQVLTQEIRGLMAVSVLPFPLKILEPTQERSQSSRAPSMNCFCL